MEGNMETTFLSPGMKSFPDSRVFQRIDRGQHSQKDRSMGPGWWSSPQMLHQRAGDFLGKGQFQRRRRLLLVDSQRTLFPSKIIECEGSNLAASQSVGRHQQKHGVVAQSLGGGSVNGPQKGTNGLPGEGAWQLLVLVQARRIDLAGQ